MPTVEQPPSAIAPRAAIEVTRARPLDAVEEEVRAALAGEGFGVLTEIDVAETLRAKLGVERRALKILGACNPVFADQALSLDPTFALVLPCNVVLQENEDGSTYVAIADPRGFVGAVDPALESLAGDAAAALERAVDSIAD